MYAEKSFENREIQFLFLILKINDLFINYSLYIVKRTYLESLIALCYFSCSKYPYIFQRSPCSPSSFPDPAIPEALSPFENSENTAVICGNEKLSYKELISDAKKVPQTML